MQIARGMFVLTLALAMAAALAACRNNKPPTSPTPPPGSAISITRIDLTGPDTVPLGQTVTFTAIAHQSDGTTRDVTRDASWNSSNSGLLLLAAPGQFTGRAKGQTSVSVSMSGRGASKGDVIIVPEGTFRLMGTVRDAGTVVEADVRIEDEAMGRTDVRTVAGRYVVFGVRGNTRLTVSKSGYQPAIRNEVITGHQTVDVDLALARPRTDLSGRYTLTVAAASECRTLPLEMGSRAYPAVVTQSGAAITVTLEGGQFVAIDGRTLNRFTGFVEAERAIFKLAPAIDEYYYFFFQSPDVMEFVTSNTYYAFDGIAIAALGAGTLSGDLSGMVVSLSGPPYKLSNYCRSSTHRFVLTRSTT